MYLEVEVVGDHYTAVLISMDMDINFKVHILLLKYTTSLYAPPFRTSSYFGKPLFLVILANFGAFWWPLLAETVKRHINTSRPFIWAFNQIYITLRSKVLARTRKRWQTDGHPNSIGPQLWGCGLITEARKLNSKRVVIKLYTNLSNLHDGRILAIARSHVSTVFRNARVSFQTNFDRFRHG